MMTRSLQRYGALGGIAMGLLLAGCDLPDMEPGNDCMKCHSVPVDGSPAMTAAGTVFPSGTSAATAGLKGATVSVVDANNQTVTMTTTQAGNFFTTHALTAPLKSASVTFNGETQSMIAPPASGACNSCHTSGGAAGARIFAN